MFGSSNYQEKLIRHACDIDSTAVSIFVVALVELTNTVFVNSINITTNFETAVLSKMGRSAAVANGVIQG